MIANKDIKTVAQVIGGAAIRTWHCKDCGMTWCRSIDMGKLDTPPWEPSHSEEDCKAVQLAKDVAKIFLGA